MPIWRKFPFSSLHSVDNNAVHSVTAKYSIYRLSCIYVQVAEANNYLAVRNMKGQYFLNGHWFIQWSGDYEAGGTVIHYKRDGNLESFSAPGPLTESLQIMVRNISN